MSRTSTRAPKQGDHAPSEARDRGINYLRTDDDCERVEAQRDATLVCRKKRVKKLLHTRENFTTGKEKCAQGGCRRETHSAQKNRFGRSSAGQNTGAGNRPRPIRRLQRRQRFMISPPRRPSGRARYFGLNGIADQIDRERDARFVFVEVHHEAAVFLHLPAPRAIATQAPHDASLSSTPCLRRFASAARFAPSMVSSWPTST